VHDDTTVPVPKQLDSKQKCEYVLCCTCGVMVAEKYLYFLIQIYIFLQE
jgi:hypothetical protein